ncbi:prephenate dehydratase domain-containing protein [Bifidobacterium xylocopae]|uniref:prephenate dehydratase n=1 Tax=Bifidobacterium xylocopae TaxID=2493119 RepID=A0A366KDN0_9BIFI|nr:prephenate dehydratase domain-containing protein [Bifidobacterium xylocopae]RBP98771.1 chorismate mutase [Bifidobacterium xylocopae]
MSQRPILYYLGPEGTFTHQAALQAQAGLETALGRAPRLAAVDRASSIIERVDQGRGWGILAWENNVEGTVVPNLDGLINAPRTAGFARLGLDITFDAFVRPDHGVLTQVSAHPHGLAQCRAFSDAMGLEEVPATSNAAACRDLGPQQVGLGPALCGRLYGLDRYRAGVQDFQGARTDFLLLAPRGQAVELSQAWARAQRGGNTASDTCAYESILALIPLQTGPGVLAGLLDRMRDAGLNMTAFMSRPIKGQDGAYSFIATVDSAPWEPSLHTLLEDLAGRAVWVKTLAVDARMPRPDPPVDQWMLPVGGLVAGRSSAGEPTAISKNEELLWPTM